ncbi:hypothetical protein [Streptomyces sp. cmx-4-9]
MDTARHVVASPGSMKKRWTTNRPTRLVRVRPKSAAAIKGP